MKQEKELTRVLDFGNGHTLVEWKIKDESQMSAQDLINLSDNYEE